MRHSGRLLGFSLLGFVALFPGGAVPARAGAGPTRPTLADLKFKAVGVVRADMHWAVRSEPCYYVETPTQWSCRWGSPTGGGRYPYLWRVERSTQLLTPPLGLRSAVPLGGLGAGTVELRADGSLRDWNIFNNSPGGGGEKVQLDDALFGLWVKPVGGRARALTLRTDPPPGLPAVAQIQYAGAYPVSRLRLSDPSLPIKVDLYAYSEWVVGNPKASATPAIIFTFRLGNPLPHSVQAAICFNLPNHMHGVAQALVRGMCWDRSGTTPVSGSMAVEFNGPDPVSRATASDVTNLWAEFAQNGVLSDALAVRPAKQGAVATQVTLPAGGTRQVSMVLAWYFPYRTFAHDTERIGNFYTRLYPDAPSVARKTLEQLPQTWQALYRWQQLCFDNDLPGWLQDALINSAGTMAKTGFWTRDGRWRQWESFSCSDLDPVHIDWYRALPYAFFFPSLQMSEFQGYARHQEPNGFIHEDLGRAGSRLDSAGGRTMGDCTTAFILEAYELAVWTGNRDWLEKAWPHVRKAAEWQIQRSARFGLPEHLNNTYDWWGYDHKDVVAYNAVLHLAALRAAARMADLMQDADFARRCRDQYGVGSKRLNDLLWTGRYYRAWWMHAGGYPNALQSDTLYGQLWASVLGLGWVVDPAKARSQLDSEIEFNSSPYGLKVMSGRGSNPVDDFVWQAGSLDWATLNLYLGGPVKASFAQAHTVIWNWRTHLADFWDWRDLSRSDNGLPWCNSHYARQVILWAIPLALSGQHYSAMKQRLTFAPRSNAPARLPWFVPGAGGVLERNSGGGWTLRVLSGRLELKQWSVGQLASHEPLTLAAGQASSLEPATAKSAN